ncbi:hypothetical protein A2U01_0099879, partial [Trifolium medium]|nr:hypothetical protein [Trifolium medium]
MQDLLSRAQRYINYKEKMLGERAEKYKNPSKREGKSKEGGGRKTHK